MMKSLLSLIFITLVATAPPGRAQGKVDLETERRVVEYLKTHIRTGERPLVSDLYNNVFKTPQERKVLERPFNSIFKIPLFVSQYKAGSDQVPRLDDIE